MDYDHADDDDEDEFVLNWAPNWWQTSLGIAAYFIFVVGSVELAKLLNFN